MPMIQTNGYYRPRHVAEFYGVLPCDLHRMAYRFRRIPVPTHIVGNYKKPFYSEADVKAIGDYLSSRKST